MKYMGHKGRMLPVLGEIIEREAHNSEKVADPFCGSASVSWFMAGNLGKPVIAGDLQSFATNRAAAIIERDQQIDVTISIGKWFKRANKIAAEVLGHFPNHIRSVDPNLKCSETIAKQVLGSRKFCAAVLPPLFANLGGQWPISRAYGGYYFSPYQALVIDALRQTLPKQKSHRNVALAALVEAASRCAAAPGHTAQPFQPTLGAAPFIIEAWKKNIFAYTRSAALEMAGLSAMQRGKAVTGDFSQTLSELNEDDLVFADPPYSGVHYSRFYHVLETITRGMETEVTGRGRYPSREERPASQFSRKSEAAQGARQLLEQCAEKHLKLIVTFPTEASSNGLSAGDFMRIGKPLFSSIECELFSSNFSTLGGNQVIREARKLCSESIMIFRP